MSDDRQIALARARLALLDALSAKRYRFTTPTPATHARVVARAGKQRAANLRDVFGWSLPFEPDVIGADIVEAMRQAEMLDERGALLASRVRVASIGDDLFLHSAYPTTASDAVFFGPDSYRFAAFLKAEAPQFSAHKGVVDMGAGSGVGAIVASRIVSAKTIWIVDINQKALDFALVNTWFADVEGARVFLKEGAIPTSRDVDLIIANPPYISDPLHRVYRDGGDMHGAAISLNWAKQAATRLKRGGAFLLYTGSAIVGGEDRLKVGLYEALDGFDINYRELDPDVFGEELEREDYADVERIAVVGVVAVKR